MIEKLSMPIIVTVTAFLIAGLMGYTSLRNQVDMLLVKVEQNAKCQ